MIRKIIKIDKEKCNGCGLCVDACHEGAIGLVDGVATLLRDDYCDGLGDCLPSCPVDAISTLRSGRPPLMMKPLFKLKWKLKRFSPRHWPAAVREQPPARLSITQKRRPAVTALPLPSLA